MNQATNPTRQRTVTNQVAEVLVLAGAASLLTWLARRVSSERNEEADNRARDWWQEHRVAWLDTATRPVTLLSMPIVVVSATLALATWLKNTGRSGAATAVAVAPVVAAVTGQSFTTFFPQREPPDYTGHGEAEASFPSGHTTGVTAEALTIAYVLWQEDLATPLILGALAVWPLLVGVTRIYRNRHWSSDVFGGWIAGTAVGALTVLLYDARRKPTGAG